MQRKKSNNLSKMKVGQLKTCQGTMHDYEDRGKWTN